MDIVSWVIAAVLVGVGLIGVLLPALPGPAFVLAGIVVAAWIDDFEKITLSTLAVEILFTLAAIGVDYAAQALGAKRFGGSRWGMVGVAILDYLV